MPQGGAFSRLGQSVSPSYPFHFSVLQRHSVDSQIAWKSPLSSFPGHVHAHTVWGIMFLYANCAVSEQFSITVGANMS